MTEEDCKVKVFSQPPKDNCLVCGKEIQWPWYDCVECWDSAMKKMTPEWITQAEKEVKDKI